MSVTYAVVEEKFAHPNGFRVGYGIAVRAANAAGAAPVVITSVHDLTSDRERIETLVDDCNRLGLDAMHLCDVVEDFLAE